MAHRATHLPVSSLPRSTSSPGLFERCIYSIIIYNYMNEFTTAIAFSTQKTRSIYYYTRMQMTCTHLLRRPQPPGKPSLRDVDPSSSVVKTSIGSPPPHPVLKPHPLFLKKNRYSLFMYVVCEPYTPVVCHVKLTLAI